MYKIDVYKRNKDGNKEEFLTSLYYPSKKQAENAAFALKALNRYHGKIPHDATAFSLRKSKLKQKWDLRVTVDSPVEI